MSGQALPYTGRITYRKHLTPDLAILRMQPADGSLIPEFKAGQFIALGVQFAGENRVTYRAYSISSPPEERRYFEFYIKWATEPVMGKITSALFNMKEDDTIYWRKPSGAFTIEDKRPDGSPETRLLVMVASGTGVAPFISYILHLKNIGSKRKTVLLHGAKYAQELGYREVLEKIAQESGNFNYVPTVSRPDHELSCGWQGSTGRVETLLSGEDESSKLEKLLGEKVAPENSFFYICGYQGTIDAVVSILTPLGFVTNRNKRKDGSFDIKIETYG
ncbi:MAG TPA: ferredoxin--NADP reductase [Nitrososphaera sp.]|nr:ferredoxin--NADP reductase [Nitrososphaera sp.]